MIRSIVTLCANGAPIHTTTVEHAVCEHTSLAVPFARDFNAFHENTSQVRQEYPVNPVEVVRLRQTFASDCHEPIWMLLKMLPGRNRSASNIAQQRQARWHAAISKVI